MQQITLEAPLDALFEVRDAVRYFGDHLILNKVNLVIPSGQVVVLQGANAAGKSTLLKCMCGLLKLHGGSLHMLGELLEPALGSAWVGECISYLGADSQTYLDLTLQDNLDLWKEVSRHGKSSVNSTVGSSVSCSSRLSDVSILPELLAGFGLRSQLSKKAGECSYGVLRKFALVRSLASEARLFLWDEPYNGLDREAQLLLTTYIKQLRRMGRAFFLVSHDQQLSEQISDVVVRIAGGKCEVYTAEPRSVPSSSHVNPANSGQGNMSQVNISQVSIGHVDRGRGNLGHV